MRVILGAAAWVTIWIVLTWGGVLDDALIHLRFAEASRAAGFLTFDGSTTGYGPSSLLFVALLSTALPFAPGDPVSLPQSVSVIFYAGCLVVVVRRIAARDGSRVGWGWLGLLLMTPMALRWMTNGMETSLATLLCLALGAAAGQASGAESRSRLVVLAALGALVVLARAELASVVACAGVATVLLSWRSGALGAGRIAGALAAGSATALGLVYLTLHTVVPDAAVAKAFGALPVGDGLQAIAVTHLTAGVFGAGLPLLCVLVAVTAWRAAADHRERAAVAVAALPVAVLLAAVILRGQALQGVRYFVPVYVWMLAFGLAFLAGRRVPAVSTRVATTVAALLLIGSMIEAPFAYRAQRASAGLLATMASQQLSALRMVPGVAYDVGFISYFSQAPVCDLSGLVNGRERAAASPDQRLRDCVARAPLFAYVTPAQAARLGQSLDLSRWTTCHTYVVRNAFREQWFTLLLAPGAPAMACSVPPA